MQMEYGEEQSWNIMNNKSNKYFSNLKSMSCQMQIISAQFRFLANSQSVSVSELKIAIRLLSSDNCYLSLTPLPLANWMSCLQMNFSLRMFSLQIWNLLRNKVEPKQLNGFPGIEENKKTTTSAHPHTRFNEPNPNLRCLGVFVGIKM